MERKKLANQTLMVKVEKKDNENVKVTESVGLFEGDGPERKLIGEHYYRIYERNIFSWVSSSARKKIGEAIAKCGFYQEFNTDDTTLIIQNVWMIAKKKDDNGNFIPKSIEEINELLRDVYGDSVNIQITGVTA